MHTRLDNLYNCGCDECKSITLSAPSPLGRAGEGILNDGGKAFKHLYKKGSYKPEDLKTEEPYQKLIQSTFDVFDFAIEDNDMPEVMRTALQDDARLFGGLKTHAQLFEASKLLLDDKGNLKPFAQLSHEFDKLNSQYNRNYLSAEYEFAVGSSQMAARWESFSDSDRYELQYRTATDNRVRDEHAKLNGITLPKSDPFWSSYTPLNGWNCRCSTVEVLKGKYEGDEYLKDSSEAIKRGEAATTEIGKNGKNRLEIFRFNPGAQKVVFPPAHPYGKVKGAKEVAKSQESKFIPKSLDNYEKTLGVKIDKTFFNYLGKETALVQESKYNPHGAYYNPNENYVRIPFDERRKNSKWYSQAIVYHEFGHAADWHRDMKQNKAVSKLMKEYKTILSKDQAFIDVHKKLYKASDEARANNDFDKLEQCGALADTMMSINSNWGYGHSKAYFARKGNSAAEFIAHTFENKFAGNPVFKEVIPELYEKMILLADELKPKE